MQVLPHALQHVLAAFAGIVTPAIIIASVCGFTPQEEAAVIQASLVLSALDIFLQQFPIKGIVGSGLPIVMGASFTFVPALKAVGLELGFEAVLGAQVIGGATIGVFATIGMNGVVMFSRHGLSQRDTTLMGLSIAFGTGIERTAGALAGAGFPAWVDTVFGGSSIAVAALVAVVLNLVLPRQK